MDPQLVDFGASLGGSLVILGFLWRAMARLTRRLDQQGKALAEVKADVAGLKEGQAALQKDVADLKGSQARMGDTLLQVVGDLGEVKGELRGIAPREKAKAGGS